MTPALERLAEMVRLAESRSRAQKLGAETQKAAERFRAAEQRFQAAEKRLREDRPARERQLEDLAGDEQRLRELTRKVAGLIATLGPEESKAYESQIEASRAEIDVKRREAQADLDAILREAEEARRELRLAREQYTALRKELDEMRPELAADFTAVDRLVTAAEQNSPGAQIQALAREIADGERHFGMLDPKEQSAQLKIWVGRFRKIQDRFKLEDLAGTGTTDEDHELLHQTFPRLVGISKVYWPGYIEAFSRNFTTDWDRYIEDAQEELRLASDAARRHKDLEDRRQSQEARAQELRRQARENAQYALDELKAVIAQPDFPEQGMDQFQSLLLQVIQGFGVSDPDLIQLVLPYREHLTGKEFRALRRHLDQAFQVEADAEEDQALRDSCQDILPLTRGQKVLMIGGSAREESRKSLQQFFEFGDLVWESHEGTRPALLKSLEERVRNRGMDLVLILKEFVGHIVPGRLRPLCEQYGIPCLMVEKGYGIRQVAETLRWGLKKAE
jgi:hypothetical protein